MANIYGVCNAKPLPHNGYSDFVQHTNPLKEGLLQTLSTDNLLNSLNSVDSTESVNPLIKLDYNESLELANLLILFNYRESRESANSLIQLNSVDSTESANSWIMSKTCVAGTSPNVLMKSDANHFPSRDETQKAQKEKGSVRSAALWDDCSFNHEENHYSTDLDNNADLRHDKNQQLSHPFLGGEHILTTIGGWDLRLHGTLSPAQTLHTEIIGIQNLQVTKRYSQNHTEIIRKPDGVTRSNPTQPFGSMPRFRSSSRPSSFNQLLVLVFASCAKPSNCLRKSAGMRIGSIGDFPPPLGCLSLVIDMHMPIALTLIQIGIYTNTLKPIKTTPRSAGTHAGRLTKPLNEVTIMACLKSNQTHPKFQYRFLALNRHDKKAKPCRLSVEATTEHEARRILAPHFILSFAARLPATIEKTSTVQEVRHV